MFEASLSRRGLLVGASVSGLALAGACSSLGAANALPIVQTAQGRVSGVNESGIATFRGIPYAMAPVGTRRFKPPVRVPRWEGVREAAVFGAACPQTPHIMEGDGSWSPGVVMGDDCLNLNVWTPSPDRSARLPVMVWIHGGSFQWGTGAALFYKGENFARNGVVCVTLNYRLAGAGFLNVGDVSGTGNFGLMDQIAALEWVQENIAAFGGDPANVTVAGESAGGFSIGQLLAAPSARGLFRRAIMQSGGAHLHVNARASELIGDAVLARLNLRRGDMAAFENVSSSDLLAAQTAAEPSLTTLLFEQGVATDPLAAGLVCVVPAYGVDFRPAKALDAISLGAARDIDLLIGSNEDECNMFWPSPEVQGFAQPIMERSMGIAFAQSGRSGEEVVEFYRRRAGAAGPAGVVPSATDMIFRIPSIQVAEAQAAHNANVYMYQLSWDGALGACHGIDIGFMFDALNAGPRMREALGVDDPPQSLADSMHGAWVNFVKTGTPHHASLPEWSRYDTTRRATMDLNVTSRMVNDPGGDARRLWEGVRY